ncbi:Gfo/Idh/MocA family protein [Paenibacillus senegalensis]|uniref:Gfo/Idh/MocA family protein n=1 Tax=Paenibacillus senegalensis TaxID=1465766 RepID=UPI000289A2E3|nr:Gfo/Idh/MocA family oxidoreductase [Paenibacillus senegalensis]
MKKWGFGLIGCGSIADFHFNAIQQLEQAVTVMISDRKEKRAREIAEREQAEWTTDYRELLKHEGVDIVCVTTSSGSHYEIGKQVLLAGKHLVVEKPITMASREADELIAIAAEQGKTISVISQRRFEPQHQAAYRALHEGHLGRLLLAEISAPFYRTQDYYDSADWRGTLLQDGGALMNQGIHSIDLLLWLCGKAKTVYGKTATQTHQMEAEDLGLSIVEFENGAFGTIMASTSIIPGFAPSLHLFGEKGSIKIVGTDITHWEVPGMEQPQLAAGSGTGGGVSDPKSISYEFHKLQLADVLDALEHNRPVAISARDGRRAVRLIEAIYESARTGSQVNLEGDEQ